AFGQTGQGLRFVLQRSSYAACQVQACPEVVYGARVISTDGLGDTAGGQREHPQIRAFVLLRKLANPRCVLRSQVFILAAPSEVNVTKVGNELDRWVNKGMLKSQHHLQEAFGFAKAPQPE